MSRIVVTGGAGFVGSHVCERLLERGDEVIAIDNLRTGPVRNIEHLFGDDRFTFDRHDVTNFIWIPGEIDAVMHLASPASPVDYLALPIPTLKVGSLGTHNALGLAMQKRARFLLTSTSEIYGDPEVHPQTEDYWGNVNPIGPRGVYDEAKRFAEALTMAYHHTHELDVRIARLFNSYGPRERIRDGRAVSTMLPQALDGEPVTVHGDGSQTRSFCYIDDTVDAIVRLLDCDYVGPVNIGNPHELTILELANEIIDVTGSSSEIVHESARVEDPTRRRPDITLAKKVLDWEPSTALREGLAATADWMRDATAVAS